ncbi:TonB-dependent receptor [Caulobacter sp. DWR1-3-2b1]|uniref:TonB-dependent receptor n=1 Tax=Caulobacter sp. DWR1-3-2b1 TaxID=2804670 RepID=UPI003CF0C8B2
MIGVAQALALAMNSTCSVTPVASTAPSVAGQVACAPESAVAAITVNGYRASLARALAIKRSETDIAEVISAEDVADFPDLNLAEALQRLPGVAIDRDAGEGRSITVRGLSSEFTRVRINGLEALATTGGKDTGGGSGGSNRGRGFDFQVFASELFNRVTVRKSLAAEVEEGSLGATVDLRPARPFDYQGFTAVGSLQQGYNDLSRSSDPRGSFLISDTWFDSRLGALFSVAYSDRQVREEGAGSGRWENPSIAGNSGGCFESPGPCNTPAGVYSPVNASWHPRIPRYERLDYSSKRLGATGALQWAPRDGTLFSLNVLHAYTEGERREDYLEAYLTRKGMDVTRAVFDNKNQMISATLDDVDVRAESRHDVLTSEFTQVTFDFGHQLSDRLSFSGAIGASNSIQDNPVQTTLSLDRYDVDGYSYDFSGNERLPNLGYNFDVTDPGQWIFTSSNALGDQSYIRLRPNKTANRLASARLDGAFEISDALKLKAGFLVKAYDFHSTEWRRNTINGLVEGAVPLPAGVTTASISRLVTGLGRNMNMPAGTPRVWLAPDIDKLVSMLDIQCNCINAYGDFRVSSDNQRSARRDISEDDASGYVQMDFDTAILDMRLRGNAGVRYATTKTRAAGMVGTRLVERTHRYNDVLPSLNLALEPRDDVVVRLGISKVMLSAVSAFETD